MRARHIAEMEDPAKSVISVVVLLHFSARPWFLRPPSHSSATGCMRFATDSSLWLTTDRATGSYAEAPGARPPRTSGLRGDFCSSALSGNVSDYLRQSQSSDSVMSRRTEKETARSLPTTTPGVHVSLRLASSVHRLSHARGATQRCRF